jgi:hypothetical protein
MIQRKSAVCLLFICDRIIRFERASANGKAIAAKATATYKVFEESAPDILLPTELQ